REHAGDQEEDTERPTGGHDPEQADREKPEGGKEQEQSCNCHGSLLPTGQRNDCHAPPPADHFGRASGLVRAEVVKISRPPVCSRYVDSCGRDRLRAVRVLAAAGLIVLSCARNAPPPRGPGSVAVARFQQGEPTTRFRVLAEQTHGLDGPPRVAVAETASELGDLWRQYELVGAPPSVDFAQDLVLAFTE